MEGVGDAGLITLNISGSNVETAVMEASYACNTANLFTIVDVMAPSSEYSNSQADPRSNMFILQPPLYMYQFS